MNYKWHKSYQQDKHKKDRNYRTFLPEGMFITVLALTCFYSCYKVRTNPIESTHINQNTNNLERITR